ncbi:MAG TPA: RDD family protein [Catenuloplanes sp.]|jgi:uncharacterized RDD family membrane protein YckC
MPALSPAGQPLASPLDRLAAYLIDGAIFSVVALVLFLPVLVVFAVAYLPELTAVPAEGPLPVDAFSDLFVPFLLLELGFLLVVMALYYIYYVEMMFRSGQTIGKKVLKIRVAPLDPAGRLTRGMAARRYLVEIVAGTLVPGLIYLDGLWQFWDKPYQQCLHDKWARTVVVKAVPR